MKKVTHIFYFLFSLMFIVSCNGQNKSATEQQKLIKNHLFPQYPEEFCFVQCGLQDKAGNMWFGSAGNGIYVYDGKDFTNFTTKDGLCHIDILCCMEDKAGNIWFGTRNGLIRYKPTGSKPTKNNFRNFSISVNTISSNSKTRLPYDYTPADNFVWSIFQSKDGKIWFGTGKGIYVHDPLVDMDSDVPLFKHFLSNDNIINKNNLHLKDVSSIIQDKEGAMWFASGFMEGEGICKYDGKSIVNFKPDGITSFRTILETKKGTMLFLNSYHGVYSYDPLASNSFSNFTKNIGIKDTIVALQEDHTGNLWFGTTSDNMFNGGIGGAWKYDGKSLKLFTTKDGLSHNCVFCIIEDKDKNIWFGTRYTGLCKYDGKSFIDFTER